MTKGLGIPDFGPTYFLQLCHILTALLFNRVQRAEGLPEVDIYTTQSSSSRWHTVGRVTWAGRLVTQPKSPITLCPLQSKLRQVAGPHSQAPIVQVEEEGFYYSKSCSSTGTCRDFALSRRGRRADILPAQLLHPGFRRIPDPDSRRQGGHDAVWMRQLHTDSHIHLPRSQSKVAGNRDAPTFCSVFGLECCVFNGTRVGNITFSVGPSANHRGRYDDSD